MALSDSTLLVITGLGIPEWSARGLRQTLRPIGQAEAQARTINGTLVDVAETQFQKYRSTIRCSDQQPLAFDAVWPGKTLTVDCVSELAYLTGGSPAKTVVSGSSRVDGLFTFYRPRLTMLMTDFRSNTDEWEGEVGWTLELEEV